MIVNKPPLPPQLLLPWLLFIASLLRHVGKKPTLYSPLSPAIYNHGIYLQTARNCDDSHHMDSIDTLDSGVVHHRLPLDSQD